jgi:hypothetical protein
MPTTLHKLNSKQNKTLEAIFKNPVPVSIVWTEVERLLQALGGQIQLGGGSRVSVLLNNTVATFHKPHPRKETDKGAVVAVRKFLKNAGIQP